MPIVVNELIMLVFGRKGPPMPLSWFLPVMCHLSAGEAERWPGGTPEPASKGMKRPIPEFGTNVFLLRASLVQRRAALVCSGKRAGTEGTFPPLNGLDERAATR